LAALKPINQRGAPDLLKIVKEGRQEFHRMSIGIDDRMVQARAMLGRR
jgi:hypothetical protein